jgi:hypothetical protein
VSVRVKGLIPMVLAAVTAACAIVAALLGQPVWAALLGSGLMFAYWGLEALTWRRAREREGLQLGLAVGGMGLRLAVVLGVLVLVGLLARPAFAAAALSFMAGFTAYLGLRPLTYSPPSRPRPRTEAR